MPDSELLIAAQNELETRIRQGRLRSTDDLKAKFPSIWSHSDSLLELVYTEYVLRTKNGEQPQREDWLARYPELRGGLERLFELYDVITGDTQRPDATIGPGLSTSSDSLIDHPVGYEILGELGRGGMAIVFQARHLALNRDVALKVLRWRAWDSVEETRRVRREAELVARIRHPNIVQVYEVGEWDGSPYLALEYVSGGTLAEALHQQQKEGVTGFEAREAAVLVECLARAVQAAHEHGVIHRDLKPANVLMADGQPKITDFGLAISAEASASMTQTAALAGTPCYMAPEQAASRRTDIGLRTDVYALGGILYELMTGRPPFQGATVLEVLDSVRNADPIRPRIMRPSLPRDLETIVLKCLEKDPARRYASAGALADDLRRFQEGRPILARPVGVVEKGWKWCRRKPMLAGMAAALLATVALGMGGVSREYWRAERERVNAVDLAEKEQRARLLAQNNEQLAILSAEKEKIATALTMKRLEQIEVLNNAIFAIYDDFDVNEVRADGLPIEYLLSKKLIELSKKIDDATIDDRLTLATLRMRIGKTLIQLGESETAIEMTTLALKTREELLPSHHPATLQALNNLGTAYHAAGQHSRALPFLQKAYALRSSTLSENHQDTLTSLSNLASVYAALGQPNDALVLFKRCLEKRESTLPSNHPDILRSMNNLAYGYRKAGQADLAIPLFQRVLEFNRSHYPEDHPRTLMSMHNLAETFVFVDRASEAQRLLDDLWQKRRSKLGTTHPDTLQTLHCLADCHRVSGRLDRAVTLFKEVISLRTAKWTADHPETLTSKNGLGVTYVLTGQPQDAIVVLENAYRGRSEKLGSDHPDTLTTLNNLGAAHRAIGQFQKALSMFQMAYDGLKARLDVDHPDLLHAMNNLASCHWSLRQLDRSIPLFENALPLFEKKWGREHSETQLIVANLGVNYKDVHRLDQARPLLEEAYQTSAKKTKYRWVVEPLFEVAIEDGRTKEALAVLPEVVNYIRARYPNRNLSQANMFAKIGTLLVRAGLHVEAEPLIRDGLAIREENIPDHWSTANLKSVLGGSLLGQKKYAEAVPYLKRGYEGLKAKENELPKSGGAEWFIPNSLDRLIELSLATGNADDAKKFREMRSQYPPSKTREKR